MRIRRQTICFKKSVIQPLWVTFSVVALWACPEVAQAQDTAARQREQLASVPKGLPSIIQHQVQALGTRMRTAGKEETVLEAQFVDDGGHNKPLHIVYQISGMVRIEGVHDKTALTFDGEFTHGVADRTDESLMDTFVMDSPEGMLYSLRKGASMVLLGHGFGPDARIAPDYKGPRYDIYVVTAPDRLRRSGALQSRRFYFDSATGLLVSTRYSDSTGMTIETRFLDWEHVDGSAYPKTIERYENGRLAFSIVAATVAGQPQRNAATFK